MTSFYWLDTAQQAATDAAAKGLTSWVFFNTKEGLAAVDPLKYEAVYLKAGLIELERAFADIMRKNRPWPC